MKNIVIILLLASSVLGVTKDELRGQMISSGKFEVVGQPMLQNREASTHGFADDVKVYKISVLIKTSNIQMHYGHYKIVVTDDGGAAEAAYFLGTDPVTAGTIDFVDQAASYMAANGLDGHVISSGTTGSVKWAIVKSYVAGTTANDTKEQLVRISKDGTNPAEHKVIE